MAIIHGSLASAGAQVPPPCGWQPMARKKASFALAQARAVTRSLFPAWRWWVRAHLVGISVGVAIRTEHRHRFPEPAQYILTAMTPQRSPWRISSPISGATVALLHRPVKPWLLRRCGHWYAPWGRSCPVCWGGGGWRLVTHHGAVAGRSQRPGYFLQSDAGAGGGLTAAFDRTDLALRHRCGTGQ